MISWSHVDTGSRGLVFLGPEGIEKFHHVKVVGTVRGSAVLRTELSEFASSFSVARVMTNFTSVAHPGGYGASYLWEEIKEQRGKASNASPTGAGVKEGWSIRLRRLEKQS